MNTERESKITVTDDRSAAPQKQKITWKQIGHDALVCLVAGLVIAAAVAVIGAVLGMLLYQDPEIVPIPWLQGAVSGTLIVGSFAMFCSAFFFSRRQRKEDSGMNRFWKGKFECFSYQVGFLMISIVILLLGCGLDMILRANM